MPALTALLHTSNDALRLGRCLETVYPCDQIVVVDHRSSDETLIIARHYGARVIRASSQRNLDFPRGLVQNTWILCLDPRESLSETLAASLYEWKLAPHEHDTLVYSFRVREETPNGWHEAAAPEIRLVPANWEHWAGRFPTTQAPAIPLDGVLLRFAFP